MLDIFDIFHNLRNKLYILIKKKGNIEKQSKYKTNYNWYGLSMYIGCSELWSRTIVETWDYDVIRFALISWFLIRFDINLKFVWRLISHNSKILILNLKINQFDSIKKITRSNLIVIKTWIFDTFSHF